MAPIVPPKLRDRDAIVTKEGLIFRVFGYSHPIGAYLCDAEYASADIFSSKDPRAPRDGCGSPLFYKFYDDEGIKFVFKKYPQYTVEHEMLGVKLVGIQQSDIAEYRQPPKRLQQMVKQEPTDKLYSAMLRVLEVSKTQTGLATDDFGVFGSMLHNFHHPAYSDIDLLIYGKKENEKMRQALSDLYTTQGSGFTNEFDTDASIAGKSWRFHNITPQEFLWHQKRKFIYGLYDDRKSSGRIIKAEFEPIKAWSEIVNEYDPQTRIERKDWVRLKARVTADDDGPFIPSVYGIQPIEVLSGSKTALEAVRIISYMEEFRQQVQKDETILVEGSLEEVHTPKGNHHQIVLTYCPRYYEQFLKVADLNL
ncbi:MAG: nucleotidyltransferase domain-containing protein [Candidatus Bathyarchaeota archaeon]|nr:nucleotidyltransferase domain-containing protein [Candidatus Bathyarchaeota archaeon]